MSKNIDPEQLAEVLGHLCDNAADDTLRSGVRKIAEALRGDGFVILAPSLIAKPIPAAGRFVIRPEWQGGEFDEAVKDAICRLKRLGWTFT